MKWFVVEEVWRNLVGKAKGRRTKSQRQKRNTHWYLHTLAKDIGKYNYTSIERWRFEVEEWHYYHVWQPGMDVSFMAMPCLKNNLRAFSPFLYQVTIFSIAPTKAALPQQTHFSSLHYAKTLALAQPNLPSLPTILLLSNINEQLPRQIFHGFGSTKWPSLLCQMQLLQHSSRGNLLSSILNFTIHFEYTCSWLFFSCSCLLFIYPWFFL